MQLWEWLKTILNYAIHFVDERKVIVFKTLYNGHGSYIERCRMLEVALMTVDGIER